MDSFEFNKIAGAVLGTLLFAMGLGIVADVIFKPKLPIVAGYDLPSAEAAPAKAAAAAPAVAVAPIAERLASADAKKGEAGAKACASCHSFEKGGANKIGPALFGVADRPKGQAAGFNYSAALKDRAAKGEKWDAASLDAFVANPKQYMPGTSMGYAGMADPARRADLVAYLQSLK